MWKSTIYKEEIKKVLSTNFPWEKFRGKNILVTGATGLIGSTLVDCLIELEKERKLGINIYILCRDANKVKKRFGDIIKLTYVHVLIQDICDALPKKYRFDFIINAASNAHPESYVLYPVETIKTNITGMINILEYAKENSVERVLFISSSEVYGEYIDSDNMKIEDVYGIVNPLKVRSCYPESKRLAETLCVSYLKEYNVNSVIVRPGHIFGPFFQEDNTRADIQFFKAALKNEDIVMKSSGKQKRSYCFALDAILAIFYVIVFGENGEAYNIGGYEKYTTIITFAKKIAEQANVGLRIELPNVIEKSGYTKITNSSLDTSKLLRLGWKPKYTLEEGIRLTLDILKNKD